MPNTAFMFLCWATKDVQHKRKKNKIRLRLATLSGENS